MRLRKIFALLYYIQPKTALLACRKSSDISAAALIKKHFNYCASVIRGRRLFQMLMKIISKCVRTYSLKELCKTLMKSSFCLSFFLTITSKYVYQLSEKTFFLSVFDFLGLIFKRLDIFLCLLELLWGLLFIKFGKSSDKRCYRE